MSHNSGIGVLVISNHSPDYSLNIFHSVLLPLLIINIIKEIKNAPSALLSYISTREFLRTREK